jgi:hypothetical protein
MIDILITKVAFKAKVQGLTVAGVTWVYRNMMAKYLGDNPLIDLEAVEEIAQLIREAKLSVEVE